MKYLLVEEQGTIKNGIRRPNKIKLKEIELPDEFFQKLKTAFDLLVEEQKKKEGEGR